MTTADAVREKALSLARAGTPTEEAIRELLECCKQKRVPVVLTRQQFLKDPKASPSDPVVTRAAELLDGVLERLPLE
jgi:nicotinamidase-related amidase